MSVGTAEGLPLAPGDDKAREPALFAHGLSKHFGGVMALRPLDLRIEPGEVRAVVGENGSGKSTLVKLLSGYHAPEPGAEVRIGGKELALGRPGAAYPLGCRFVHQDLGLVDSLTVLENLCLTSGFPSRMGTVAMKECRRRARADLARFGVDIDPDVAVGTLGATLRTCVAIARAMHEDEAAPAVLLVLDEPTAAMADREVDHLLMMLRQVADGGVGVLYITHRLSEVFRLADTVTVLRDGVAVTTEPARSLDRRRLISLLVGASVEEATAATQAPPARSEAPLLSASGLVADGLDGVSLEVYAGEVVGLAGAAGSAREVLLANIFGATPRVAGRVTVDGVDVPAHRADLSISRGVAYLPPDRKLLGGMMDLNARENLMLASLAPFWRSFRLHRRDEVREAASWFERLDIRPRGAAESPFASFSGGNQQKILLAKWLRLNPRVLLVDEPTQGVDVAARASVHHYLLETARKGTAVVVSSSDVEELTVLCDRVLVFRGDCAVAELHGGAISVAEIARNAYGAHEVLAS